MRSRYAHVVSCAALVGNGSLSQTRLCRCLEHGTPNSHHDKTNGKEAQLSCMLETSRVGPAVGSSEVGKSIKWLQCRERGLGTTSIIIRSIHGTLARHSTQMRCRNERRLHLRQGSSTIPVDRESAAFVLQAGLCFWWPDMMLLSTVGMQ